MRVLNDGNHFKRGSCHLLSHNHLTFGRLSGGLKRNLGMPFSLERRKHCNLLQGYGWRGAIWGIKRRVIF